jgi:hypothetical protein
MKWIQKFDAFFLWVFFLKGMAILLTLASLQFVLVFYIIRYRAIGEYCKGKDRYSLSIDLLKNKFYLFNTNATPLSDCYYVVKKNEQIVFKFRIKCIDEGYMHPYIYALKNDTLIIGDRKFSQLVLLKIATNRGRLCLRDVKFEYIDKSGFPGDTSVVNYDLRRIRTCYDNY